MISRKRMFAIFWILVASTLGTLDVRFRDLKLGEPAPEDYQLLEALLDGRRADTEKSENYVGESEAVERGRAVIDFTIDWLRCILDKDVNE